MVVMMDIEISCKGHCEKLSHFLDHVSHTALAVVFVQANFNLLALSTYPVPLCFLH